jgi:hypothetical protein
MRNYQRVIPRDLFNESKLLQQLGFLCLAIHDWKLSRLKFEDTGNRFDIQLSDEGELSVTNLTFLRGEEAIRFWINYNSRTKNPLLFENPRTGDPDYVFDDQGEFTSRFFEQFN